MTIKSYYVHLIAVGFMNILSLAISITTKLLDLFMGNYIIAVIVSLTGLMYLFVNLYRARMGGLI